MGRLKYPTCKMNSFSHLLILTARDGNIKLVLHVKYTANSPHLPLRKPRQHETNIHQMVSRQENPA